jgi:hypothetical protein
MMRVQLAVLGICALLLALPVLAQDETTDSHLVELLRYVPDHVEHREWIQFGDLEAWYESWGMERIEDRAALLALSDARSSDFLAFAYVMPVQTMPPDMLGIQSFMADDMRAVYGFDIFSAERYLQAGPPPDWITVVQDATPHESVAAALSALDYAAQPIDPSGTLYSLGEDFEMHIQDETLLRVGQMGNLNRIALLDNTWLIAKATTVIDQAVEAGNGDAPSLGDDSSYQALAAALEEAALSEDALLVGALLTTSSQVGGLDMAVLGTSPEEASAALEAAQEAPPLPAYSVVAFATLHKPGTSYSVIALVFPEGTDAQAAADSLDARIRSYTSLRTQQPFTELLADHGARIVEARGIDAGRPAALLIIADDDPTFETTEDSPIAQTAVFNFWPFITARDTGFLAPSQPD